MTKFFVAALLATAAFAVPAAATPLVIDGVGATSEGDCTFACVVRYQQVYNSPLFGNAPTTINSIKMYTSYSTGWNASEYQLKIGYSSNGANGVNTLSSTFNNNILAPVVFGNTIFTQGQTQAVGSTFGFNGSFVYNPALGDLVIDITRISGADSNVGVRYNYSPGGEFSRAYSFSSTATAEDAGANNYGNATLFDVGPVAEAVPEPAMLGLFGMGAIGLGLSRRRRA